MLDTATIYCFIDNSDVDKLLNAIRDYGRYYSDERIHCDKRNGSYCYCYTGLVYFGISKIYVFRRNQYLKNSFVEIKVRFKRLNEYGYCWEVAEYNEVKGALENLNKHLMRINATAKKDLLPKLKYWEVKRVDFAVDVSIASKREFYQILNGAKCPNGFFNENYVGSCYMKGDMLNVNFYDKGKFLEDKNIYHLRQEKNTFRFEFQVKRKKIKKMIDKNKACNLYNVCTKELLNSFFKKYYSEIVGTHDFVSFKRIRNLIRQNFTHKTKTYLLKNVSYIKRRGYSSWYDGISKDQFKRVKKYFEELGVSWIFFDSNEIKFIKNEVSEMFDMV